MESFSTTSQKLQETVQYIRSKTQLKPKMGIVLGSGLGAFVKEVQAELVIPFKDIPNFMPTTIEGHQGNMIFGKVGGHSVVTLQGRNHFYEGHSMDTVVFPTRTLALLGVEILILTNSAGGIADGMEPGDFMIIDDHINLVGANPLTGPNNKEFGPRFPDMSEAYDHKLTSLWESILKKNNIRHQRGVYAGLSGPTYETPAEVRFLKLIGCSAVGMSTVSECIAANHMGLRVAAMSCISNLAAGIAKHKLTHSEVTETGKRVEKDFTRCLKEFVLAIQA
jgi:purine-nucleoside phosphorylase